MAALAMMCVLTGCGEDNGTNGPAKNQPPTADAGVDQTVVVGTEVTLDGSVSSDPDGDVLTYRWHQTGGPSVTLSDASTVQPTFTPAEPGTYIFSLVVNDGKVDNAADEVTVTVESPTLSHGEIATFTLPGGAEIEMVWIEPGMLTVGSPSSESGRDSDEGPQHEVTIGEGLYLGKYELTQGQWESVMATRPWAEEECVLEHPDHPAVHISWNDMQEFIRRLNAAEGSEIYRLPTEAEWEYACRAGTTTRWSFGDNESQLGRYAWYDANAWDVGEKYAHEVGTKLPNAWGLYDMHGNVWEWCQDWYEAYTSSSQVDPTGPSTGSHRVVRGGDFYYYARLVRSANRGYNSPGDRGYGLGARLLRQGP